MNKPQSLIEIRRVSKVYGPNFKALDNISLKIGEADFVSITGPSGSGKSTLMHIIGLLDVLSSGQVFFEGKDVSKLSEEKLAFLRNKKVGFVFQQFNLLERTTALANVALPLVYSTVTDQEILWRAKSALESVGLGKRANHYPNQLSGGEQQRVAIARALVNNPAIILADEPTGNLDSKSGQEILAILKRLNKEGKTIVLVTHEEYLARQAKHTIRLKDGKIINYAV